MNPFQTLILCIVGILLAGLGTHLYDHRAKETGTVEAFLEPIPPIQLTTENTFISLSPEDRQCLALNIYHEAKHEPYIGKIAVAQVTYQRLLRMPEASFCQVVYAPYQFSWTLSKKLRDEVPKGPAWEQALHVTEMFARGVRTTMINVDHYHADYIKAPYWSKAMHLDGQVSRHIFYASNR